MEVLTARKCNWKAKGKAKYKHFVLECDRSVCAHTVITTRSNTQLHPLGKILTLLAREKMTKRVFVTVGTTSFDVLIQAATEDTFLKVCYVEASVHICCVHNEQISHSTLKVLWLCPYPFRKSRMGWWGVSESWEFLVVSIPCKVTA